VNKTAASASQYQQSAFCFTLIHVQLLALRLCWNKQKLHSSFNKLAKQYFWL